MENAYDDFAKYERTGDVLPIDNYPVSVSKGDVFVIDYHTRQNTIKRTFYICDGKTWNGRIVTEEFVISEGQK